MKTTIIVFCFSIFIIAPLSSMATNRGGNEKKIAKSSIQFIEKQTAPQALEKMPRKAKAINFNKRYGSFRNERTL